MDYVYKLEEFENAIGEIAERTNGRVALEFLKENHNPQSGSRAYREFYNDQTRKLIAKQFEKDIDEFQYSF